MSRSQSFEVLLTADGAIHGRYDGQDGILHFGDFPGEYRALTAAVGVVPLPDHTEVELTGGDRAGFLNRLCTNKVDRLAPGTGAEAFLTDAKAHVVAHVFVFAEQESLVLFSLGAHGANIASHLDRYLIREKVNIRDRSSERSAMLLAGPGIESALSRLGPGELPAGHLKRSAEAETGRLFPAAHLSHTRMESVAVPAAVRAVDLGGRPALLVASETERASDVWRALRRAGARPCGWQAADAARIEAGWPIYGRDISEDSLPHEVARDDRAISLDKGCYLGQETIARIDSRGHVNQTLVGLRFHGADVPPPGTELTREGQVVGNVTSAAFSPGPAVALGLGYVRRGSNSPGLVVHSLAGLAEVTALPINPSP